MAYTAIVYRIYPNEKQKELIEKTFGCTRFVYNQMLSIQEERYKNGEKHLSYIDMNNYCNQVLKKEYEWLKEVDKWSLSNALNNLNSAYQRFFKKLGKHPNYKSKHRSQKSYTTNFSKGNIKVLENKIQLPKLGKVKAVIHRQPEAEWIIKSATLKQLSDNSYQVSVLFQYEKTITPLQITEETTLGLDYKSNGLYMDSNGNSPQMEHYYRQSQDNLAKRQRKLRHKKVGSNNYNKQIKKVNKIHRHITNQRKDFLHKQSTMIAKEYNCVCVEDLNMRAMSNKGFGNGKSTLDNGYGMFIQMLDYKLSNKGGKLVKVDRWFPSSQICNCCGVIHPEMKDIRNNEYLVCECGYKEQRDINAARNIKFEGLRVLGVA